MKLNKKMIIVFFILLLLFLLAIPDISSIKTSSKEIIFLNGWSENFDNYSDGQFLDGTSDDGGWEAWDENRAFGAYITNEISRSSPNSVMIEGSNDIIHQFEGYSSGLWKFSAWVYIPNDFVGHQFFSILSEYSHGGGQESNHWGTQIRILGASGTLIADYDGWELPFVWDEWAQFLAIIDLDADYYEIYYNNELLMYKLWTAGPIDDYAGILEIQCLNLYAHGASALYYDDFNLSAFIPKSDLNATGNLNWRNVEPSEKKHNYIEIVNEGVKGSKLNWEIESWPEWGEWNFIPSSGEDLINSTIIEVIVVAPNETNSFSGEVKIINKDNISDFAIIPVLLVTPKNRSIENINPLIKRCIERFPIFELLL